MNIAYQGLSRQYGHIGLQPKDQNTKKDSHYSSICMSGSLLKKTSQQYHENISQCNKIKSQRKNIFSFIKNKNNKRYLIEQLAQNQDMNTNSLNNHKTYRKSLSKILSIGFLKKQQISHQKNSLLHKFYGHQKKQNNTNFNFNQTRSLILDGYRSSDMKKSILLRIQGDQEQQESKILNKKIISLLSDKPFDRKIPIKNQIFNIKLMKSINKNQNDTNKINYAHNNACSNIFSQNNPDSRGKQPSYYKISTQNRMTQIQKRKYKNVIFKKSSSNLSQISSQRNKNLSTTNRKRTKTLLTISDEDLQQQKRQIIQQNDELKCKYKTQQSSNRLNELKQFNKNTKDQNITGKSILLTNLIKFQVLKNKKKYKQKQFSENQSQKIIEEGYKEIQALIKHKNQFKTKKIKNPNKKDSQEDLQKNICKLKLMKQKTQNCFSQLEYLKILTIRNSLTNQKSKHVLHINQQKEHNKNYEMQDNFVQLSNKQPMSSPQKAKRLSNLNSIGYKTSKKQNRVQRQVTGWQFQKNPQTHQQYQFSKN